jgi:hypothetical protein
VRSGKTLRLPKQTERGDPAVRSTDGETQEIATGHGRVDSQDGGKVEADSVHFTSESVHAATARTHLAASAYN